MAVTYELAIVGVSGNGWNGDFAIDDTGDLVLAVDSATSSDATVQRVTRVLLTNPRLFDAAGNPIAEGDDFFHPDLGAGLRADVGENFSDSTIGSIKAAVLKCLADDPGVDPSNPGTVEVTAVDSVTVTVKIVLNTITGQQAPVPLLTLTADGA